MGETFLIIISDHRRMTFLEKEPDFGQKKSFCHQGAPENYNQHI